MTELCVPVEVADVRQLAALATMVAQATLAALHLHVTRSGGLKDLYIEWEEWEKVDADYYLGLARLAAARRRLRLVTRCSKLAASKRQRVADEHLLAVVAPLPHLEELIMVVLTG